MDGIQRNYFLHCCTVVQNCIAVQLPFAQVDSNMVAQLHSCTVVRHSNMVHSCTVSQFHCCAGGQQHGCTVAQLYGTVHGSFFHSCTVALVDSNMHLQLERELGMSQTN